MPVGGREKFNSCYRLYNSLSAARLEDDEITGLAAWSSAFGVTGIPGLDDRFDTLHALRLLTEEKDRALQQVDKYCELDSATRNDVFNGVSQTMNVAAIGAKWSSSKQHLTDQRLRTLRACSREIPEDGETVDNANMRSAYDEIDGFNRRLEEELEDGELKAFLLQQLSIMRRALVEYDIIGTDAFRQASGRLVAEMQKPANQEVVNENKGAEYVEKLKSLWLTLLSVYNTHQALQSSEVHKALESAAQTFFGK